jgi:hypothetical protein
MLKQKSTAMIYIMVYLFFCWTNNSHAKEEPIIINTQPSADWSDMMYSPVAPGITFYLPKDSTFTPVDKTVPGNEYLDQLVSVFKHIGNYYGEIMVSSYPSFPLGQLGFKKVIDENGLGSMISTRKELGEKQLAMINGNLLEYSGELVRVNGVYGILTKSLQEIPDQGKIFGTQVMFPLGSNTFSIDIRHLENDTIPFDNITNRIISSVNVEQTVIDKTNDVPGIRTEPAPSSYSEDAIEKDAALYGLFKGIKAVVIICVPVLLFKYLFIKKAK